MYMKKIVFTVSLILGLLTLIQTVKSQEQVSRKYIFSEFGGPGVIFSINFDSRFKNHERLGLGYRIGMGFGISSFRENSSVEESYDDGLFYDNTVTRTYYSVPVGLNYVFGKKTSAHTFEIGAGTTFLTRKVSLYYYDYEKPGHFIGHLQFMYRRVPVDGGFSFRVGFTPIIGTSGDLFPMGAIGFGYIF
jgi:hypothetical protein